MSIIVNFKQGKIPIGILYANTLSFYLRQYGYIEVKIRVKCIDLSDVIQSCACCNECINLSCDVPYNCYAVLSTRCKRAQVNIKCCEVLRYFIG